MSRHARCRVYFAYISEFLDGELDQITGEAMMGHIEVCPECLVCWTTFKKSVELFKNLGPAPLPSGLISEIKAIIEKMA